MYPLYTLLHLKELLPTPFSQTPHGHLPDFSTFPSPCTPNITFVFATFIFNPLDSILFFQLCIFIFSSSRLSATSTRSWPCHAKNLWSPLCPKIQQQLKFGHNPSSVIQDIGQTVNLGPLYCTVSFLALVSFDTKIGCIQGLHSALTDANLVKSPRVIATIMFGMHAVMQAWTDGRLQLLMCPATYVV